MTITRATTTTTIRQQRHHHHQRQQQGSRVSICIRATRLLALALVLSSFFSTPYPAAHGFSILTPTTTTPRSITLPPGLVQHRHAPPLFLSSTSNGDNTKLTVFLIRHAETNENIRMRSLVRAGKDVLKRNKPSLCDVQRGLGFVATNALGKTDSKLSTVGKEQVLELRRLLRKQPVFAPQLSNSSNELSSPSSGSFPYQQDIGESVLDGHAVSNRRTIIAHSPLTRAKETCYGALLSSDSDTNLGASSMGSRYTTTTTTPLFDTSTDAADVVELECLREVSFYRQSKYGYDMKRALQKRIQALDEWLASIDAATTDVVLVGHSEYFRILLNQKEKFRNCDVWRASYCPIERQWDDLELQCRLESAPKEVL